MRYEQNTSSKLGDDELGDDFTDITILGKTHWITPVNFKCIFYVILHKLYCQIAILHQLLTVW